MASAVRWQIQSLAKLSLFDQVDLDAAQIGALPKRIAKKIFEGYADVLNQMGLKGLGENGKTIQFAAKTTEDGTIFLSCDGGTSYQQAGPLKKFPKLVLAMRQACDAARTQFPEAFRKEAPIAWTIYDKGPTASLIPETRSIILDVNSLTRNSLAAAKVCQPLISISGIGAGILGIAAATDNLKEGKRRYDRASALGDGEGKTQAELGMSMALFYNILSFGMVGTYLPSMCNLIANENLLNSNGCYPALAEGGALALSLALIASSIHEWRYISPLKDDLASILQRETSASKKAIEGLEFLQQQLSLTEEDWGQLRDKGLDFDGDSIRTKYLEKIERLLRRVGPEVISRISKSADLVERIKSGDSAALKEAKELIELAELEVFKKRVREITYLVISIMAVSAVIVSFVLGAGMDFHLLYAINAGIWLTVDSSFFHETIGKGLYRWLKPNDEKRWGKTA